MGKMRRNIGVFEKFVDAIETEWYNIHNLNPVKRETEKK